MKAYAPILACLLIASAGLASTTAHASSKWQKPTLTDCELGPGQVCNVEVACPAEAPFVAAGGGGFPKAEPKDNSVAMTMNLPISNGQWRVRWRNLSGTQSAKIKTAVRVKCSDRAEEAGW